MEVVSHRLKVSYMVYIRTSKRKKEGETRGAVGPPGGSKMQPQSHTKGNWLKMNDMEKNINLATDF